MGISDNMIVTAAAAVTTDVSHISLSTGAH